MDTHSRAAAALIFAAAALAAEGVGTQVSTLDDIHYWVGEGTNRCGIVVDWAAYETAKAWGYRWNGVCTNLLEVVRRIAHEDPRLKLGVQRMGTYWDLYFFGYDVNDSHPAWDLANGAASDADALALREDSEFYPPSVWWVLYGPMNGAAFPTSAQTPSPAAADQIVPADADWFVFSHGCPEYGAGLAEVPAVLRTPAFAESPYGHRVVASFTEEKKADFNRAANVLGHPTMYMEGPWGGPVSPYNAAWKKDEVFSLVSYGEEEAAPGEEGGPGYVTIAFDHDVVDDPANPYGIDFLVFGNSFGVGTTDAYYSEADDPAKVTFTGKGAFEEALVEVSQDGKTWHAFADGPYADGPLPTLGYQYDPAKADPRLFDGNRYWGPAAWATRPVDPKIGFADFAGLTLAEVCQRYNGSAGGTGYDISALDLPVNAAGRKWFRYVRISGRFGKKYDAETGEWEGDFGYSEPEVDAVADVAPASGYARWVEANYADWHTAWRADVTGPEARAANGQANAVNYALGLAASEAATGLDFRVESFAPGATVHRLTLRARRPLADGCGVVVQHAASPKGPWTPEMPVLEGAEQQADGTWRTTFKVSASGDAFFRLALDVE